MKYRIIDRVNTIDDVRRVIVKNANWFDRLFGCWFYLKDFPYNDDKTAYPHRTRNEAIAEARKFVEAMRQNKLGESETVVQDI